ncbi:hypothetical protein JXA88_04625 [Candidatus Fermentibacteria bacterium]|nr:hypothetical protein [Candidatus Fermentibacteria bacterium]
MQNRTTLRSCSRAFSALLLMTLIGFPWATAHGQARQFPDTRHGIHIFYDQPPYSLTAEQRDFLANHYVGCQKIPLDLVNAIRAYNDDFMVLNYRLAFGTYENLAAYLVGNDWVNDWDVVDPHTDWFITDAASPNPGGRIMQQDWGWYLMDISGEANGNTTAGWKEYWASSVVDQLRSTNCDGVFADSHCFPWNLDYTPSWLLPPDDVVWIHHMEVFGNHALTHLHNQPEHFYYVPNVGPWITSRDTTDYGAFVDGVMVEMFGSPGPWDLYDIEDWKLQMNRLLDLERRDKVVICQAIVEDEWAGLERMYSLANYLLIKGERTYYNLVFGESFWGRLIFFPECTVELGAYQSGIPLDIDDLWVPSLGVYERQYENGRVLLNPTWNPVIVPLDCEYHAIDVADLVDDPQIDIGEDGVFNDSLAFVTVSGSVTVEAKGGMILLQTLEFDCRDFQLGEASPDLRAYPVPSRGPTTISCLLPAAHEDARVGIYDLGGRRLCALPLPQSSGRHEAVWDGRDEQGCPVSAGVYLCSLESSQGLMPSASDASVLILSQ